MNIKISTDSTADIPVELLNEFNISALPLTINLEEKQWLDGVSITPHEFYAILEESDVLPTTAGVSLSAYLDLFESVWKDGYTDLIHTCLNGKGSSTYQNAVLARDQFFEDHPEATINITVLDSQTYSMGYGMVVVEAARMARSGEAVDSIVSAIEDWNRHVLPTCLTLDLKCVKKSGRITAAAAFVGDAIGLKPIIQFEDGEAHIISKSRGEKKGLSDLLRLCLDRWKPGTPYALALGNNEEVNKAFYKMAVDAFGAEPAMSYPIGCIIALNAGPNLVGVIFRS